MQTRPIPCTGQPLPVIGCGTWLGFDVGGRASEIPRRGQVLEELFAAGGTVVDSSPMYGTAEDVVGQVLEKSPHGTQAFVATKVWTQGRRPGVEQMERSLRLLRRERIELMQVHNLVDWEVHLRTLRDWKAEGRLQYIGVTHYTEATHAQLESVLRAATLDFVQFNYSVAGRGAARRLLPLAQELGVAVLVNLPFGGGKLLRSLHRRDLPGWAQEIGCTSWNQVLLKFVLSQPAVTCVIPGTSSPEHMRDNTAAGEGPVPQAAWWEDKLREILD